MSYEVWNSDKTLELLSNGLEMEEWKLRLLRECWEIICTWGWGIKCVTCIAEKIPQLKAWKFRSLPFELLLFSRRQWPREFILFWSDASLDIEAVRGGWLNFLRRSNEGSGHEKYLQYFAHNCNFHEKCESNLPGSRNRSLLSLILRPLFS